LLAGDIVVTLPAMPTATMPGRLLRLQRLLLVWYRDSARDLPWRRTRDPYRILVSEMMLQQTQAARVAPVYETFLRRFPTVHALAAATPGEVLIAWQGLGYNRRAVSLHRAARAVVAVHGGVVPSALPELLALPGIGQYTARAVATFAFHERVGPVDTNIGRVLARAVMGAPLSRTAAQALADDVVPASGARGDVADWSQALMDLGARTCTARAPRCDACPIAATCAWLAAGGASALPDPAATTATRARPQAVFAGSDRYHRGRLVDALRWGPVAVDDLCSACGLDDTQRLVRITNALVDDGLVEWSEGQLRLPA